MQISSSTFLITGGAAGLGAACVRQLVADGGRVVIADLNEAAAAALAGELGAAARFATTDVTDADSVQASIAVAAGHFGRLDGVVHCAGIAEASRLIGKNAPNDLALFERIVRINLLGTFNVARLAAAAMTANPPNAEGERGVIVITSSVAAFEGQIGLAAYAASKGGVAALTLPLARELAGFNIRVATIAPGWFDTAMMAFPSEVRKSVEEQIPFPPRLGRPEEFARMACHIIENPMLNGCIIRLDGALRMDPKRLPKKRCK